jgi:hypothetical protein
VLPVSKGAYDVAELADVRCAQFDCHVRDQTRSRRSVHSNCLVETPDCPCRRSAAPSTRRFAIPPVAARKRNRDRHRTDALRGRRARCRRATTPIFTYGTGVTTESSGTRAPTQYQAKRTNRTIAIRRTHILQSL